MSKTGIAIELSFVASIDTEKRAASVPRKTAPVRHVPPPTLPSCEKPMIGAYVATS